MGGAVKEIRYTLPIHLHQFFLLVANREALVFVKRACQTDYSG
jgi:hypothetical protein